MTPAERTSAVAFAEKNCALEALRPSDRTLQSAQAYRRGLLGCEALVTGADTDIGSAIMTRTIRLIERGWPTNGDLRELITIHRGLFTGVFADAGRLRTSNLGSRTTVESTENGTPAIGRPSGHPDQAPSAFFPASLIETGAMNITTELAEHRNLSSLDRSVFTHALAKLYDELGYLHPFAEGNALTLRIFASRLAHDAGWDLDWATVTREQYQRAKHEAYRGDIRAFEDLFAAIQRPANPTRIFLIAGWDQGPAH